MTKTIKVLKWVTASLALALGAALIALCLKLFFSGGEPVYTRSSVSGALKIAAVFAVPFVILWALTGILSLRAGSEKPVRKTLSAAQIESIRARNGEIRVPRYAGILRLALLILAALLIVWGIFNGSLNDVMIKAKAICMECIGIG